jgi:hypothetical protein
MDFLTPCGDWPGTLPWSGILLDKVCGTNHGREPLIIQCTLHLEVFGTYNGNYFALIWHACERLIGYKSRNPGAASRGRPSDTLRTCIPRPPQAAGMHTLRRHIRCTWGHQTRTTQLFLYLFPFCSWTCARRKAVSLRTRELSEYEPVDSCAS